MVCNFMVGISMKLVIIIFVMTRINEGLPAKQTKMSLKKCNNNPNRKF